MTAWSGARHVSTSSPGSGLELRITLPAPGTVASTWRVPVSTSMRASSAATAPSQRQTSPIRTASICSRATWPLPISASTALAPGSARAKRV
ncbi:hypothetical protein J121_2541 [Qipengyuania citrea LAMA 915]|uniref:Uncharacterized protein n=1 Tax=Qipengyuania citrea LAMA 915 TaxID=1306953 RepID=A0A0L1KEL5_9SPHN|nr:hypothetical protein J121_2541 [Qipengyuania citrea LAMA 915]